MTPNMGIRHVGAPRVGNLFKAKAISTLLFSFSIYVLEFKMDFSEEKSGKEMGNKNILVLSEYAKNLEGCVKERYVEKISVVGVDPASLPSEQIDS